MITRFAPSPTGPLHLGHAYSAMLAHDMAKAAGGTFLLRIEDIDGSRARPAWEEQIYNDLRWLGLSWPEPVMRQSERLPVYREALQKLWDQGLLFPCDCSRRDVQEAASAPQEGAPAYGPDGLIYPGTCRSKPRPEVMPDVTLRLDMHNAARDISYVEGGATPEIHKTSSETLVSSIGDVVLARRDMGTSYHLSVVLDDAAQGITDVVRGADLAEATPIHVLLQQLLDLPTPRYHHHRLIRDDAGRRLAKRDDARAIHKYRKEGATPADIRQMVGLPAV
ncbi:tRNA glutamyl-Q(34) synthetase GluQRS [Cognatiyoonia sp. IB215182]|uniref:tRNA glutamyl-Q(34) synthetase GluQRS n=1 Tax=Cognatiyoonia sp. IB215182 TaxID=3097353 RepID=UPI002A133B8A|nr:tRNA glutamyl-Q(34) synthetase GluQRS [Cognatiyoonia sp. IB215182]MDX8353604.1 tRNA glutamyl-Q(34) synthetase GluQRS [Cognatiyoonia sp. IB215182]